MLAHMQLCALSNPTKPTTLLPVPQATASLLASQLLTGASCTGGFMRVPMSSAQHHTLPGHSQLRERTINPTSQMRGVRHGEVDNFTVKSPIQMPTTLAPQPFPNPFEQPRALTTCCSRTTACGDGGYPLSPLLLLCVLPAECFIFFPSSEGSFTHPTVWLIFCN